MSERKLFTKSQYIEYFRDNGFICFPLKKLAKKADYRYKASATIPDQKITEEENYGIIPIKGNETCLIDLDNKEEYREFAEENIKNGYMVIETGKGWHIPVKGLKGSITKIELYNYAIQDNKIIEFQGPDHYIVGVGSIVDHDLLKKIITYENKGSEVIWDAKGKDFHDLIDFICKRCNVTNSKRQSRSTYKYMRQKFLDGKIPGKGQSNDYFHQAAIQCNTNGVSQVDALEKIRIIYDKWYESAHYSGRPWSNIERKVQEVYENDQKAEKGRPKKDKSDFAHQTALRIMRREIYSDKVTSDVYENKNGFLELINYSLHSELQLQFSEMTSTEYNDIIFKLVGLAEDLPETDKNIIRFPNGTFDKTLKELVETKHIADMGFKQYQYLEKTPDNTPKKFEKILFEFVPKDQHPRIKAGLRAIFSGHVDSRISVLYGNSGVGKSTALMILCELLGSDYTLSVELEQILRDPFIKAKIKGKYLVNIQDMPKTYKDFTKIKNITGEPTKSEREFHKDMSTFENKIKIWGSANYLFDIPEEEKDTMFARRLSLIHNTKETAFEEDPEFAGNVIKEEGEKIISWILNFSDEECKYEDKKTIQKEWEEISAPEVDFLGKHYQATNAIGFNDEYPIMTLCKDCKEKTGKNVSVKQMNDTLNRLGYIVKFNSVKNMEKIPKTSKTNNDLQTQNDPQTKMDP